MAIPSRPGDDGNSEGQEWILQHENSMVQVCVDSHPSNSLGTTFELLCSRFLFNLLLCRQGMRRGTRDLLVHVCSFP